MKKIIVLLIMLMLVSVVHAGIVERSLEVLPNGDIKVDLNVDVVDTDTVYVIKETLPVGWELVSTTMTQEGTTGLKAALAKAQAPQFFVDTTYSYVVKAPEGVASGEVFSGTYLFTVEGEAEAGDFVNTGGTTAYAIADPTASEEPDTSQDTTCLNVPALATLCPGATEDGTAAKLGCSPIAGACEYKCNTGLTACGNTCVDKQVDNNNCGSCSNVCDAGKSCVAGICSIPQKAMQDQSCGATADCETGLVCENGLCTSTLSEFLQDMKEFEEDHPDQIADYEAKKKQKSFSAKFVSAIAKFFKDLFN